MTIAVPREPPVQSSPKRTPRHRSATWIMPIWPAIRGGCEAALADAIEAYGDWMPLLLGLLRSP
jgi:hypothetical protein